MYLYFIYISLEKNIICFFERYPVTIIQNMLKYCSCYKGMKYCTVRSFMSKGLDTIDSNNHMCAERQLIRQLYRRCMTSGYKSHQFRQWLHRKHGHLVIYRKNIYGDAISLPCVLCRKMIERYDIYWTAYDGKKWIHSQNDICLPVSRPTEKQCRNLGFKDPSRIGRVRYRP